MADTQRTMSDILALSPDNISGAISPQDYRDALVSLQPSFGMISEQDNTGATTLSDTSTWVLGALSGTSLAALVQRFDSPSSGRLRYTGPVPIATKIIATVSMTSAQNNQVIELGIAVNGVVKSETVVQRKTGTGSDVGSASVVGLVSLDFNDYVEIFVRNITSASNITLTHLTMLAHGDTI